MDSFQASLQGRRQAGRNLRRSVTQEDGEDASVQGVGDGVRKGV